MLREAFIMQRTIEVSPATATSIATPSKTCSPNPSNSIVMSTRTATTPALTPIAPAVPKYTYRFNDPRSIFTRYPRMIPTINAASMPSRSPMIRFGMIPTAATCHVSESRSTPYGIASITAQYLSFRSMESGNEKSQRNERLFPPGRLRPFVHRSAAVPEQIDGNVEKSGVAQRAGNLFGDLGGNNARDVRTWHLDPRYPIMGAHSHDPESYRSDRSFRRFDALQLFHGDHLAVRNPGG